MDGYISRKALMRDLSESLIFSVRDGVGEIRGANKVIDRIKAAPAADVVEVVRCEKCVHKVDYKGRVMCGRRAIKYDGGWCGLKATDSDHYCSYGDKRKDGAE